MLVGASRAVASEPLANTNVKDLSLAVDRKGEALLTYRTFRGSVRHVLVWGAIDARLPNPSIPQVRFRYDYSGGWKKYRDARYWKSFRNMCRPYDGPPLQLVVVACDAPDGSYWAVQSFQRGLPLLGFRPWRPAQSAWEFHVSHWRGPLPQLTVAAHWTYGRSAIGVFGRVSYKGVPVYGFKSTAEGNPLGRYERNVYIDTHDSAYGPGWARESGILTHAGSGVFCHSFVPQKPFPGYPSRATRPAAPGDQFRFTVMGPGVTPVVQETIAGLAPWTGSDEQVAAAQRAQQLWDAFMRGDRKCAPESGS